jgi:adenine deaminase
MKEIKYLSEMMNYPGVIYKDPEVIRKLECEKKRGKSVDGHAPGLSGEMLRKYVEAGITTDHECSNLDRYKDSPPATGFIKGFNLKKGAFASSIAHDSHNIISVGTNDKDILNSINEIVRLKGGLAVSTSETVKSLQLNIGGIMTTRSCDEIAHDYDNLNKLVNSLGCAMKAPFMTLSFMALLVIPDLKIGDRGLFDVKKFEQVSLFVE